MLLKTDPVRPGTSTSAARAPTGPVLAPAKREFAAELEELILTGYSPICVGLEPRVDALPRSLLPEGSPTERIVAFYDCVLPVLAPLSPLVKPNLACFELYGAEGWACYEKVCALARSADLLVIGDVKRGDFGGMAEACAEAHFQHADALTLNPYLGTDGVEPFFRVCERRGKGAFVLVSTSNASAREFQDLRVGDGSLAETVARRVHRWGIELGWNSRFSPVGAVVGTTSPNELLRLRALMPRAWLLLPAAGPCAGPRQLTPAFDKQGLGAIVTQSDGVLQCFDPEDRAWLEKVRAAIVRFADEARAAMPRSLAL